MRELPGRASLLRRRVHTKKQGKIPPADARECGVSAGDGGKAAPQRLCLVPCDVEVSLSKVCWTGSGTFAAALLLVVIRNRQFSLPEHDSHV